MCLILVNTIHSMIIANSYLFHWPLVSLIFPKISSMALANLLQLLVLSLLILFLSPSEYFPVFTKIPFILTVIASSISSNTSSPIMPASSGLISARAGSKNA